MAFFRSDYEQPSPSAPLPAPRKRTLVLAVLTLVTSVFLTGWVTKVDEDIVTGQVSAPVSFVRAPADGWVQEWTADDGTIVAAKSEVLQFVDQELQQTISAKRESVAALQIELQRRRAKAEVDLAWRTREIESEILANRLKAAELIRQQYDQQIELHAWKDRLQGTSSAQYASASPDEVFRAVAYEKHLVPETTRELRKQFETVRNSVEVMQVQIQLCEDRLRELHDLKQQLPTKVRRATGVDEAEARLKTARQQVEQLEAQADEQGVLSPAYGRLQQLVESSRQPVKRGDALAKVIDHERRYLSVTVPPEFLGRFNIGQTVTVRFPRHHPRQGLVTAIGTPSSPNVSTVTVTLKPRGRVWPLVPLGSAADVVVPKD